MRVFVIWDLTSSTIRTLLEALPELITEHRGIAIDWQIPHATATGPQLARDVIAAGLRDADHVIALIDRPSASVGWQVGLALGFARSLKLAFIGSELPAWTQVGVLKGLFAHHLSDVNGIRQLLELQPWQMPEVPKNSASSEPHAEPPRLVLCPSGPVGSTLREVALQFEAARALPEDGWGLYELPALLAGRPPVAWILASDVREGADNASNGVVAGFAEASGLEVAVLRAEDTPPLIDVQPRELRFAGLTEFKQKLSQLRNRSRAFTAETATVPSRTSLAPVPASGAVTTPHGVTSFAPPRKWTPRLLIWGLLVVLSFFLGGFGIHKLRARSSSIAGVAPAKPVEPTATPITIVATPTNPTAAPPQVTHPAQVANDKDKRHAGSPVRSHGPRAQNMMPAGMYESAMTGQIGGFSFALPMVGVSPDGNLTGSGLDPTAPAAPAPSARDCKISDVRAQQIANSIHDEKFSLTKQQVFVVATKKVCPTIAQLYLILEPLGNSRDRLEALNYVAARVRDPGNAQYLITLFPDGYEREQALALFQR